LKLYSNYKGAEMSLTYDEEQRIKNIEQTAQKLSNLMTGAASKNMLNRLLTLCNEENRRLSQKLTEAEAKLDTLITLARKLQ
jgi:hypothetical protein